MRNRIVLGLLLGLATLFAGCTVWRDHPVRNWADATGGEGLERNFWKEVKARNWDDLERHLAPNFVSVTAEEGRLDRTRTLEHYRPLQLDDYSLGDFQVELNGEALVVAYSITMRGRYGTQPLPAVPVQMVTVWQKQKSGWIAITHAVISPGKP